MYKQYKYFDIDLREQGFNVTTVNHSQEKSSLKTLNQLIFSDRPMHFNISARQPVHGSKTSISGIQVFQVA